MCCSAFAFAAFGHRVAQQELEVRVERAKLRISPTLQLRVQLRRQAQQQSFALAAGVFVLVVVVLGCHEVHLARGRSEPVSCRASRC